MYVLVSYTLALSRVFPFPNFPFLASFPGPRPASRRLQCGKALGTFSRVSDVTYRANYANLASGKPRTTLHDLAIERYYSESKDGSARRRFYVALHEPVGRTESFYQGKTVKTHSAVNGRSSAESGRNRTESGRIAGKFDGEIKFAGLAVRDELETAKLKSDFRPQRGVMT